MDDFIQYLGDGTNYVEGVPARNLTRDEWNALREERRAYALATGLYVDPLGDVETPKPDVVTIDLRDGADDDEANVAARTLNARRKK